MSNPITNYPLITTVTASDLLWDWQSGAQQACTMAQVKAFMLGGGSIVVGSGKTLTANNTLTLTGTDGSTIIFGSGGTVLYASSIGATVQAHSSVLDALAALASPSTSGYILACSSAGVFSWVPQAVAATASGTNTYTATPSPALTAYSQGQQVVITFPNANSGGASLNLNGLGAVPIYQAGAAIGAGQIPAGAVVSLIYDGSHFQIIGQPPLTGLTNSFSAITPSATGSSTIVRGAATTIQEITLGTGSGAYTYTLTAGTTGALTGDIIKLKVSFPASVNPTLSIVGTATTNISGSGAAYQSFIELWYNGTSWDLALRSA